jgi:hypothetical protein
MPYLLREQSWKSPATKRYEENKRRLDANAQERYQALQREKEARRPKSDMEKEAERLAREEKRLRDHFGDLIR